MDMFILYHHSKAIMTEGKLTAILSELLQPFPYLVQNHSDLDHTIPAKQWC